MPSWWAVALVLAATLLVRLLTVPPYVESADGWAFVSGVERYSVAEGRPHWPGYPLYIALGKLVRLFTGDAPSALHLLAILSSTAAAWPILALASRWTSARGATPQEARRAGLFAGLLWMVLPGSWLTGSEILSDPTGLLLSLLVLYVSWRALEDEARRRWIVLGLTLAAALVAVRLAYAPLLAPLLPAVVRAFPRLPRGRTTPLVITALLLLCLAVLALPALFSGAGSLEAGVQRWHEHFGAWPRRVLDAGRLGQRVAALGRAFAVHAWGGWWPGLPLERLVPTAMLLLLVPAGLVRLSRHPRPEVRTQAALYLVPYLLVTLLSQDVALVRYALPLLGVACVAAALGLPKGRVGIALALVTWGAVAMVAVPLAVERRASPPLGHQLAEYARYRIDSSGSMVLVTTDVAWAVPFVKAIAPRVGVQTVGADELATVAAGLRSHGLNVYATRPPAVTPEEWSPVACFRRSPLLDSRGPHELWLYKLRLREREPVPTCD